MMLSPDKHTNRYVSLPWPTKARIKDWLEEKKFYTILGNNEIEYRDGYNDIVVADMAAEAFGCPVTKSHISHIRKTFHGMARTTPKPRPKPHEMTTDEKVAWLIDKHYAMDATVTVQERALDELNDRVVALESALENYTKPPQT